MILWQDATPLCDALLMNVEEIPDTFACLFIGSAPPNATELSRCKPMCVKRSRIQRIMQWLIKESGNSPYSRMSVSDARLNAWCSDCDDEHVPIA